jgi:hypothetical protein
VSGKTRFWLQIPLSEVDQSEVSSKEVVPESGAKEIT